MKKLINDVGSVVPQALAGLAMGHPGIALLPGQTIAIRADAAGLAARGRVALISGGGAGHEPAHAGYVGPGLLTAAVAGEVFTSPSTDAVLAAIEAVAGPAGVLLIVKNYTGDRLNFGLAAELARSRGLAVDMVVVADDVALAASDAHAGRRGIAGTVFVHKVAGAAAAAGASLADVREAARQAADAVGTMGVALSPCTVPAAGRPGFTLGPDEIELGLGIHGEPGIARETIAPADVLVDRLLATIVADRGLGAGDRVALLVNNLGGTPSIELSLVTGSALQWLQARGLVVERAWTGSFLTALDMGGVSLSLLRLDDARLAALDAPAEAPAWPAAHLGRVATVPRAGGPQAPSADAWSTGATSSAAASTTSPSTTSASTDAPATQAPATQADAATPTAVASPVARTLLAIAQALEAAEDELTRLDQQVGDGDLGLSLARGARAVRAELAGPGLAQAVLEDLPATLRVLAATLRRALGGTSGPLYAIGLLRAAAALADDPRDRAGALAAAAQGIADTGGARRGDGTMLDALLPSAEAWARAQAQGASPADALARAAQAAADGAAATAGIVARRGRASYLGERSRGHVDPGARAVAIWMQVLAVAAQAR